MHLVFLNQYFPPDEAPTGVMLDAVAEAAVEAGHEVTVVCGRGGYGSGGAAASGGSVRYGGARIIRLPSFRFGRATRLGKLVDYASFYVGTAVVLATLRSRLDLVVALTTPPYLGLLARFFSRMRGCRHAHWVMDLYPDVMTAHGMLRESSPLAAILRALTRWSFGGGRCAAVLGLGPDMAARLRPHAHHTPPQWIPLWSGEACAASQEAAAALRRGRGWRDDELVVMYSGNMGLGHSFAEILEVARLMAGKPARFVFFGTGGRRGEIQAFAAAHPGVAVEVHDYAPAEDLAAHLRSADLHFVSLRPEWDGAMVPSKLPGIFAAGRPALFIGSATSSIGQWILESGGGRVVPPGGVDELHQAIERLILDPEQRARMGAAAEAFAVERFDRERNRRAVLAALTGQAVSEFRVSAEIHPSPES